MQGTAGLSLPEGVKLKDALSTLVDEMGWAELAEQTGTYTYVWMCLCLWHMYSIEKDYVAGQLLLREVYFICMCYFFKCQFCARPDIHSPPFIP